ncbi:hypothetical protein ABT112_34380 [Streptomyces sp. NPDC002055]|uniref:hypothetical protein n=1 Tax=Streptomyces sp. NPDC002055 TaxID=3154534 RepID=UPI00331BA744
MGAIGGGAGTVEEVVNQCAPAGDLVGIESDRVVFDYLSRVGDLAQQQQMPSGDRMRLVTRLRSEIEQQRAGGADSPAAVKRILGKLGTPAEVVGGAGEAPDVPSPAAVPLVKPQVPVQRQASGAAPPHLAGEDELGPRVPVTDWWRVEPGPFGGPGQSVPGFSGGIEIPEMLEPPERAAVESAPEPAKAEEKPVPRVRGAGLVRRVVARRREETRAPLSPLLVIAAGLLVAGAVLGNLVLLGLGWVVAYGTRRLSRIEAKFAAVGLPGLVAASAVVWLWGRVEGRWGEPVPKDGMAAALGETWPVALRTAAVASALFLVWRARRRPRGN